MRQSDIEQMASQWVILQEVDSSEEQIAELNRWLDADPRNRVTFLRIREAWRRARRLRALRPLDGEVDVHLLKPEAPEAAITVPPTPARRGWHWAIAAAVIGVCLLVSLLWTYRQSHEIQTYVTAIGGHRRVMLADGTTIELNTNTVLRTRISPQRRDVYLDRGEAFFRVTHIANSPFTVTAGHSVIQDIGTAFDVRLLDARRPDDVDILVLEGRVIAYKDPSGFASTLTAGDHASVASGTSRVASIGVEAVEHRLAWRMGSLFLWDTQLDEAVRQFNRYNRLQLRVEDPSVAALRTGGIFSATDPESFVAALRHSFRLRPVEKETPDGTPTILLLGPALGQSATSEERKDP